MKRSLLFAAAIVGGGALGFGGAAWVFRNGLSKNNSDPSEPVATEYRLSRLELAVEDVLNRLDRLQTTLQTLDSSAPAGSSEPRANSEGVPSLGSTELTAQAQFGAKYDAFLRSEGLTPGKLTPEGVAQRTLEQLEKAGFTRDRAEWIEDRTQELRRAAIDTVGATRDGADEASSARIVVAQIDYVQRGLRETLGDTEYEQYRRAIGLSTEVRVKTVLNGSVAAAAGMLPGDAIRSYDGHRVFDLREINDRVVQRADRGPVLVEVVRDGATMQLSVPRGPLGIVERSGMDDFMTRAASLNK